MALLAGFLLVASAACLGWGIRGEWGNWWGETVPGVLVGMAIWVAFGESDSMWQMIAFGAALAIAHTIGGDISYGRIVGYAVSRTSLLDKHKENPENRSPLFGLLALFLVGGMIGFFPATALGLLLTDVPYGLGQLALWAVLVTAGALMMYKLAVMGLGLRLSPPRSDFWAVTLGASVASVLFFSLLSPDRVVLRTGGLGWLCYGTGFAVGGLLHRQAVRRGWRVDSWKWMEHSVGLFGGMGLGVSVLLLGAPIAAISLTEEARLLSALVVFWVVPYLILTDVLQDWTFRLWHMGTPSSVSLLEPDDPESKAGPREGEVWKTITSRRVFAGSQLLALCSLGILVPVLAGMASVWKGDETGREVFGCLILMCTAIAILKSVPIDRGRSRAIVWATFAAIAGFCLVILGMS